MDPRELREHLVLTALEFLGDGPAALAFAQKAYLFITEGVPELRAYTPPEVEPYPIPKPSRKTRKEKTRHDVAAQAPEGRGGHPSGPDDGGSEGDDMVADDTAVRDRGADAQEPGGAAPEEGPGPQEIEAGIEREPAPEPEPDGGDDDSLYEPEVIRQDPPTPSSPAQDELDAAIRWLNVHDFPVRAAATPGFFRCTGADWSAAQLIALRDRVAGIEVKKLPPAYVGEVAFGRPLTPPKAPELTPDEKGEKALEMLRRAKGGVVNPETIARALGIDFRKPLTLVMTPLLNAGRAEKVKVAGRTYYRLPGGKA
jgi:hypothetical protein